MEVQPLVAACLLCPQMKPGSSRGLGDAPRLAPKPTVGAVEAWWYKDGASCAGMANSLAHSIDPRSVTHAGSRARSLTRVESLRQWHRAANVGLLGKHSCNNFYTEVHWEAVGAFKGPSRRRTQYIMYNISVSSN